MEKILKVLNDKISTANVHKELTNRFGQLQTDEERVLFTLDLMTEYDIVPNTVSKIKDSNESTKLRNLGNKIFIERNKDIEALEIYTKSIALARNSSLELAMAYANRSAVLARIQKNVECLDDIDRALKLGYPDNLKAKLCVRKVVCLAALGRPKLEDNYKEARYWLEKMSLNDQTKEKLKDKLKCAYDSSKIVSPQVSQEKDCLPPIIVAHNSEVPCVSDSVGIRYNDKFGRHIIATRNIKPGEVLAVEKPYSLILDLTNIYTHCSNCLRVSWASIPCERCIYAMYCSELCKADAWRKYHDVECPVIGPLLELEFNTLSLFSLRLAILATREVKTLHELRVELDKIDNHKDPRTKGFSDNGKFHSNKYRSIYSLVTNVDKRSVPDLFGRALNAAYIVYFLATRSSMFGTKLEINVNALTKNSNVTFVGGLILKHQQIIPSNIHSFQEARNLESVERGAAAMPFYSLINHSCDPNVTRQSLTEHIVMYALYPIAKGEQIFDNYSMHYALTPKNERQQKLLKQFYFKCECVPCKKEWPLYDKLSTYESLVQTLDDKHEVEKSLNKYEEYLELVKTGNVNGKPHMLTDLLNMIEVLFKYVPMPCKDMNNIIETVKCIYSLNGNKYKMPC